MSRLQKKQTATQLLKEKYDRTRAMLDATKQSNKSQKTVVTTKKVKRAENNDDDDSVTDNENSHDKD